MSRLRECCGSESSEDKEWLQERRQLRHCRATGNHLEVIRVEKSKIGKLLLELGGNREGGGSPTIVVRGRNPAIHEVDGIGIGMSQYLASLDFHVKYRQAEVATRVRPGTHF